MGVSYRPYAAGIAVRSGAERATLVRRTYLLVFAGILITMLGAAFGFTQPAIMTAVARHPFLSFLVTFVPLLGAQALRDRFPANIGLTLAFTFAEGVWLSPVLYFAQQQTPGIIAHLQGQQTRLVAPRKKPKGKELTDDESYYNRLVRRIRQPIESLFNWMEEKTQIQRASKVRSTDALMIHCWGKLAVAFFLLVFNY